jgi:hypothetical protein
VTSVIRMVVAALVVLLAGAHPAVSQNLLSQAAPISRTAGTHHSHSRLVTGAQGV